MTGQIFSTKLLSPVARSDLVLRPHLSELLDQGIKRKLTLISAPAGYGKSTLLAAWLHVNQIPTCWLSVDADDNDPTRFWTHFTAALRTIFTLRESQFGEKFLEMLYKAPTPGRDVLFGSLVTDLAAIPEPFILILDDFHMVSEAQVQDGLLYLLEALPAGVSGMHLVLSSRQDPPWPLARLRGHDQINELRAQDLRFTHAEAAAFLNDVMKLELSPMDVGVLDQRTEGWAAGLQMAALAVKAHLTPFSLGEKAGVREFIAEFSGSHRFVLDYLMEEVLNFQQPEILEFLLKTSVLERMTGPLCAAVTGNGASPEILLRLEKENMFLVALDDERTWYRYHHLFADLLLKRLMQKCPGELPTLHRLASQWYARAGYAYESVAHALKTEDWPFTAAQIEGFVLDVIQQGELTLARKWIVSLPEELIRPRPILCIAQAWVSASYDTVEFAEGLLAQAEVTLAADSGDSDSDRPNVSSFISRQIAVLQVVIARARGESTSRQQELIVDALNHIVPAQDHVSRASLYLRLGFCYLDLGKDEQADRLFSQAFLFGQSSGNLYAAHSANYGRMVIARRHGNLHRLAATCRKTLEAFAEHGSARHPLTGFSQIMSGGLYYEWNELEKAQSSLAQGMKLVEKVGTAEVLVKGSFWLASTKIARGQNEGMPNLVEIAERGNPSLVAYAAALQSRLFLKRTQGSIDGALDPEAMHWAGVQKLEFRSQPSFDWEIAEKLIYARIFCWMYRIRQESKYKEKLTAFLAFINDHILSIEKMGWFGILVEVYAATAVVQHSLGNRDAAFKALEKALTLAEPQAFVRTFVDEGEVMRQLLVEALPRGICEKYARKLISAFEGQRQSAQLESPVRNSDLIEPLSERELQVLRLLSSDLSVPEIAAEIYISPSTVRTHVQNIYRKLDVHRRLEALQKAALLRLL